MANINKKIKEILKHTGGVVVIMEGGEIEYVISSYEAFIANKKGTNPRKDLLVEESKIMDKVNKDIEELKTQQDLEKAEKNAVEAVEGIPDDDKELRIEEINIQ